MIRPNKKELIAIRNTRIKWDKVIKHVRKTPTKQLPKYYFYSLYDILISLNMQHCELCEVAKSKTNTRCKTCILSKVGQTCDQEGTLYGLAHGQSSKKKFLEALINLRDFNKHLKSWN